ncbi:hypothetical protein BD626DRAFT_574505 [Schizophyllum amplum]|uniref:Carbohydrate-binding module family 19 domain-containing protein n=1 Tax=Schizophyllum amplum TaxID=97359 RepID=A0A550BY59_9AGAR|nr:hypothetical protein BD626DRAFT_574505 [Auriculariopsis ampla]
MVSPRILTTVALAFGVIAAPVIRKTDAADGWQLVPREHANVNTSENARQAQALNSKFASLKQQSTCKGDEIACVAGIIAQCKAGQWDLSLECAQGTTCLATPRTDSTGTDLQCTTPDAVGGVMSSLGVQGGINGTDYTTYATDSAISVVLLRTQCSLHHDLGHQPHLLSITIWLLLGVTIQLLLRCQLCTFICKLRAIFRRNLRSLVCGSFQHLRRRGGDCHRDYHSRRRCTHRLAIV